MGYQDIAEIRRTSAIKKRALSAKRSSDAKELNAYQAQERKEMAARHRAEDEEIRTWFRNEMQLEAEYVADAIRRAQW